MFLYLTEDTQSPLQRHTTVHRPRGDTHIVVGVYGAMRRTAGYKGGLLGCYW